MSIAVSKVCVTAPTVRISILFGLFTLVATFLGQTSVQRRPAFEAATVKPFVPANVEIGIHVKPGGRVTANDVTLKRLMSYAYGIADYEITGPDWINSDRWSIEAKAEDGTLPGNASDDDPAVALMMQTLLEERFHMKPHREIRELPAYSLTIAKGGAKIELSSDQAPPKPDTHSLLRCQDPQPRGRKVGCTRMGASRIKLLQATAVPIAELLKDLSHEVKAPVTNETGLQGLVDYKLEWKLDLAASSTDSVNDLPDSIFSAVQEQLGLRLVPQKAPIEVLIVDSVQKPTP